MASTLSTATLPSTQKRRDSSEDFGAGSLGSIGGSAVGSSVGDNSSNHHRQKSSVPPAAKPVDGAEVAKASKGSPLLRTKRAAKRRKGSVDFSLSVDDSSSSGPLKKRKTSVDFSLAIDDDHAESELASRVIPKLDTLPSMEAINSLDSNVSPQVRGSASIASSQTHGQAISALDHLDALGEEAGAAAAKVKRVFKSRTQSADSTSSGQVKREYKARTQSMDSNGSSHGTFASNSQRMLLEAFMTYDGDSSNLPKRDRHESSGGESSGIPRRDRLDGHADSSGLLRRDRFESWGGMSDLSVAGVDNVTSFGHTSSSTAAALASLANDVAAAANLGGSCDGSISSLLADETKIDSIPSKICVDSTTGSDPSAGLMQASAEPDLSSDLQAFVKAAMASVGSQLAELATAVESAANTDVGATKPAKDPEVDNSDMSSSASLIIGATSDSGSKVGSLDSRPLSLSVASALNISVDYDAVAAAVNAAEEIDLSAFEATPASKGCSSNSSMSSRSKRRRHLPTHRQRENGDIVASSSVPKTAVPAPLHADLSQRTQPKLQGRDLEEIRERARAAAGYVPPSSPPVIKSRALPPKKRGSKRPSMDPQTPGQRHSKLLDTPRTSNAASKMALPDSNLSSPTAPQSAMKTSAPKGQSGQKWDNMFDCLVEFIAERRADETQDMTDKEKEDWIWDGNVPTTFKTKDGKALGRWVNNQRSAKSKGVLKEDREDRLVKAGLKWSVLASNSWNEMLEELRLYVNEQTQAGRKWDGNVPTNYRIKTKNGGKMNDEDKNLGRWVNRQRSLYQAGKLRKDRQLALEKVGLKWSMLATTSWESMFDTLCDYVKVKTAEGAEWDGNVPANYRTNDNPPRALGRWINRQRSAYVKDKLKTEYVEKLNSIGLKWSVHERRPVAVDAVTSAGDVKKPKSCDAAIGGESGQPVECGDGAQASGGESRGDEPHTDRQPNKVLSSSELQQEEKIEVADS